MKKAFILLIATFAFAAMSSKANAQSQAREKATKVVMIANSTTTCVGVDVSSAAPATQVLDNSSYQFRAIFIENEDASADIRCNERSDVANSGALRGKRIRAGKWFAWLIPYYSNWYCINNSGTGTVEAMICRTK